MAADALPPHETFLGLCLGDFRRTKAVEIDSEAISGTDAFVCTDDSAENLLRNHRRQRFSIRSASFLGKAIFKTFLQSLGSLGAVS